MSIIALKLALEALDGLSEPYDVLKAQKAIREALAQPEQEPVAWATQMGEYAHIHWGAKRPEYPMVYEVPLYTSPQPAQQEPDYKALYEKAAEQYNELAELMAEQPAQQQEPVAWMHPDGRIWTFGRGFDKSTFTIPLYTTPPSSSLNSIKSSNTLDAQRKPLSLAELFLNTPQRKPLSMQERTSIVRANKSFHDKNEIDAYGIIDDVEAAHGIKE